MSVNKVKLGIKILLLVFLLHYLISIFNVGRYVDIIAEYQNQIIIVFVIILSGLIFIDIASEIFKKYARKKEEKAGEYLTLNYIFKYVVYVAIALMIFGVFYKNVSSLVVSVGLIGAAITYALQKPILNFAGWVVILYTRTIKIGDRISIKNIGAGDVFDIDTQHLYLSELTTDNFEPTGKVLIIPNSYIFTTAIENLTKGSPYVWDSIVLHFTHDSDVEKARQIVFESTNEVVGNLMLKLYEKWSKRKYLISRKLANKPVIRVGITRTSFYIKVYYLVNVYEKAEIKTKIQERILKEINKERAVKLSYPHVKAIVEYEKTLNTKNS